MRQVVCVVFLPGSAGLDGDPRDQGGWQRPVGVGGGGSEQLRLGPLPASSVSCVPNPRISCVYSCKSSKTAPVAHEALQV